MSSFTSSGVVFAFLASTAVGQQPSPSRVEFTADELYQAFRYAMRDADALQFARGLTGQLDDVKPAGNARVSGTVLNDDLLIVLSLLSDGLREKVQRYRDEMGLRNTSERDRLAWDAKRAEIKRLMDEGLMKPVGP